jgi:hypothetical protein
MGEQRTALFLLLVLFSLLFSVPQIGVVNATSKTYELELVPGAYQLDLWVDLRKGDRIRCSFTVSNLGPYKDSFYGRNGTGSFCVNVKFVLKVMDRPEQVIGDFANTKGDSFNYVAPYAGVVEINTYCSGGEFFQDAKNPVLTINYEIEAKPIELINPNLLAWWKLDEGKGTVVTDSSGNEYEGIIHGADWITNQGNVSLNFDGEADYVSLATMDLREIDALTVVTWINSDLTEEGYILFHGDLGEFTMDTTYLDEANQTTQPAYARFSVDLTSHGWYSVQSSFPMKPNMWHQIVGVWERGVSLKVYIDGVLAGENNDINGERLYNPTGGSYPSSLGIDMQGYFNSQTFFKGQISNVIIFNKTLTTQELTEFYNCGPFEAPNTIPEFPSRIILSFFLIATLFAIVFRKRLSVSNHKNCKSVTNTC